MQLKDLKIKALVDFIEYKGDTFVPQFKKTNYFYLNIRKKNEFFY